MSVKDSETERAYDVIIIGAGAAGLMCAIEAGKRGRRVWLVDHATKIAEKIRISGGGRCNFTNLNASPDQFLSTNPHFCKSALRQYTQHDFIAMVNRHQIAFHEKRLGQLFCDESAQDIIDMLLREADEAGVQLDMETEIGAIRQDGEGYLVETSRGAAQCQSLVIACGGLSIPKIGATKFGYEVARQFDVPVVETRAALVPLTFQSHILDRCKAMAGLSVEAVVECAKTQFSEGLLFTHRGLSGPSILQISSYWREGLPVAINLAPATDIGEAMLTAKQSASKQSVSGALAELLPKRLAQSICDELGLSGRLAEVSSKALAALGQAVNHWQLQPAGSEGYRTAEVTLGGVDTRHLSSKTMQAKNHDGLFFIGEVVDVTGHLGGYNFQWAWSSGFVAGEAV